jgi:hypothetical protein
MEKRISVGKYILLWTQALCDSRDRMVPANERSNRNERTVPSISQNTEYQHGQYDSPCQPKT